MKMARLELINIREGGEPKWEKLTPYWQGVRAVVEMLKQERVNAQYAIAPLINFCLSRFLINSSSFLKFFSLWYHWG